jgi:hypothetical protein
MGRFYDEKRTEITPKDLGNQSGCTLGDQPASQVEPNPSKL